MQLLCSVEKVNKAAEQYNVKQFSIVLFKFYIFTVDNDDVHWTI